MSEIRQNDRAHANASAGHLALRIEGAHPAETLFLFEQRQKRIGPAAVASVVYHVLFVAGILFAVRYGSYHPTRTAVPETDYSHIVWLNEPGPGGGGGGGGNRMKAPPRKAEAPGREKITVQVEKPPQLEMWQAKEPPPLEPLNIPAKSLADAQQLLPGAIEALPGQSALSLGSGSGGGSGTGAGTGSGPGRGPGLGPGSDGGTGGDVARPGNDVTNPVVLLEVKPGYTSDAMRARIQGVMLVECVVETNGICNDAKVTRSFTPNFGLDLEAIKAAQKWRFKPGLRRGEPVPVLVTIELSFRIF
jgi:TonB family protein